MTRPIAQVNVNTAEVIATIGTLRKHMVQKQRIIGHQHPRLVTEGRDQGSVAFPDAAVKFYLDADAVVRARRRAEQLREAGKPADETALLQQIIDRDRNDSAREDGPLICPPGAHTVDTSDLSLEDVLDTLEEEVDQVHQLTFRKSSLKNMAHRCEWKSTSIHRALETSSLVEI